MPAYSAINSKVTSSALTVEDYYIKYFPSQLRLEMTCHKQMYQLLIFHPRNWVDSINCFNSAQWGKLILARNSPWYSFGHLDKIQPYKKYCGESQMLDCLQLSILKGYQNILFPYNTNI